MKIGPIDVSYRMLIYAGILVAEVIGLWTLWNSNSEIRAESIYRSKVMRGLFDEKIEQVGISIEAAQQVIQYSPQRVDAKLYLGSLQYRQKEFKAAQKTFEDAAAMANATSQHKAWALTGAAASAFSAAGKDDAAKGASDAEKIFKQASDIKLDGGKRSSDALAGLAILTYLKRSTASNVEALTLSDQALAAGDPPALKVLAQLYNIRGLIQAQQGKALDATNSFTQAQFLRPERTDFAESRRLARLESVFDTTLGDAQRLELLQKLEREMSTYGKNQPLAWTLVGQGYGSLKTQKDYLRGPYTQALAAFQRAITADATDLRPYRAKSHLIEERLADVAKALSSPLSGMKGESPIISIWGNGPTQRLDSKDSSLHTEIRQLLTDSEATWNTVAERTTGADKLDARLRQLAAVRRLFWLTPDNDVNVRNAALDKMLKLGNEIVTLDAKSGRAHYTLGLVHIERGDFGAALGSMKTAKANGVAAPELDKLIDGLALKPEVLDIRPGDRRRWFGSVPLISASLRSTTVGYKQVKMQVDGKDVEPVVTGTQVLYVPDDNFNMDGSHTVKVSVLDKFENAIDFPEFSFGVDKKAPSIKIIPEDKATVGTKPVWTITLSDASGVDASSTRVIFKTIKGPQMITRDLVKDGKFKIGLADLQPPVRVNSLAGESFRVVPGQELQPGEYALEITSVDLNGNPVTETKRYTVK